MGGMITATHKVTIENGYEIKVDGIHAGRLDGRGEVYVVLGSTADWTKRGEAVARFKRYLNKSTAKTIASRWVKFVLARMTVAEVLEKIGNNVPFEKRVTPMQLAYDLGYPKPTASTVVA
jgi:hypothetical protein